MYSVEIVKIKYDRAELLCFSCRLDIGSGSNFERPES